MQTWEMEERAETTIAQTWVGISQVKEVCVVLMNTMDHLVQGCMTLGQNPVPLWGCLGQSFAEFAYAMT